MVTISTIIPAFNSARYVGAAIRSALDQRGVRNEVIVIDDGSSDRTGDVIKSFGDLVRSQRTAKFGPYKARNLGAKLVTGEWLAFLDADDEWLPDKLATQLARSDEQTDLIYTDRLNFGDLAGMRPRLSETQPLWEGDVFEPLLMGNFITLSSVLMRKRAFESLGGFAEATFGVMDWDLWLRYAAAGGRVKACKEPLTRYRWHSGAISNDLDHRCADRLTVVRRALALPRAGGLSRSTARRAFATAWEVSARYASRTRLTKALTWYLRSALCWPWKLDIYKEIAKCCIGMK
jgi:glycosyltransferase involved in cell wall biosynthesis